ncbi:MAG: GNAT family N-acetyltransferase [Actinomycetes bacterium]
MPDRPAPDAATVAAARDAATGAARAADVTVLDVHDRDAAGEAADLFDAAWGRAREAGRVLPPELLVAMGHAGCQVSVARAGDELAGATAALVGLHDGEVVLHSHVTAVPPGTERRGVGRALKLHQRAWALERGITTVRWTFDPLIRRNVAFNLVALGARVSGWADDLYGPMPDARNAGTPSHRLVAMWDLTERRVQLAAAGRPHEPDVAALRGAGAVVALDVGPDGGPVAVATDAPRRLVRVPEDVEALRTSDPELAHAWSTAVRDTLGTALLAGARVVGATRDGWIALAAGAGGGPTELAG